MAAPNISLLGATYPSVAGVTLPKSGGGTATFPWVEGSETKTQNGTYDVTKLAQLVVNVAGGGSGIGTLLSTTSLGTISTSSTSAADTGKDVTVKGIYAYDALIVETSVNTVVNNRHLCTVAFIWLTAGSAIGTKNGATIVTGKLNMKASSNGTVTSRQSTTARGIYPYDCTVSAGSSGDNGQAVMNMYQCYNSTQTGTINNAYTTRVYGLKLYDLIGG